MWFYTQDIPKYTGMSIRKYKQLRDAGLAPEPRQRGGQNIYFGADIKRFFGIDDKQEDLQNDPFKKGLQKIGGNKK